MKIICDTKFQLFSEVCDIFVKVLTFVNCKMNLDSLNFHEEQKISANLKLDSLAKEYSINWPQEKHNLHYKLAIPNPIS